MKPTASLIGAGFLLGPFLLATAFAADPASPIMLVGDWVPDDSHQIDHRKLPRVPAEHVVVSNVRKEKGVNQHNYLAFHDGRYFAMWSDGPGIEDRVGQRVKFATSPDGLAWTDPAFLTPEPPGSGPESPHYGTRTDEGMRWISRGFWQREGELLALCALDEAAGFFGPSLELHAFRLTDDGSWQDAGVVAANAINNFPPKRIATGDWMMSRRTWDYKKTGVQFLVGGVRAMDDWKSFPVLGTSDELSAEEPLWWSLPDDRLVALFRDNRGSKFLFRSVSSDNGRTWNTPVRTNFPDATSKLFGLRISDGRYILVSNSNPRARDPLTLAVSDDGIVFNRLAWLVGGRHVDYPHAIEHDGHLLVAFAGGKQSVEVLRIDLAALDAITMPDSVELEKPLPVVSSAGTGSEAGDWIDLGDEGTSLFLTAKLTVPQRGRRAHLALATRGGEERVILGVDAEGRLTARLFREETVAENPFSPGDTLFLLARLTSHRDAPDRLEVAVDRSGSFASLPDAWTLVNERGRSDANLARLIHRSDAKRQASFHDVRIAPSFDALENAPVLD